MLNGSLFETEECSGPLGFDYREIYCAYIDPLGYSLIYKEFITIELRLTVRKRNILMIGYDVVNRYKERLRIMLLNTFVSIPENDCCW
jgi:hypothetical protein